MTITQLEYIIALDTYRHFATAAGKSFVTQPTLSMQVRKLEEELGSKLFDRSKQPVIPTEIGEEVIQQARMIVHEVKMMHQLIQNKRGVLQGELSIGIIPTLAPYLLPLFLQPFLNKYPDIKIRVKEMTTDIIIEKLKSGKIDAGLLVTPLLDNSIKEYPLFYEELIAYVSKKNAAYKKTYVLADDIDLLSIGKKYELSGSAIVSVIHYASLQTIYRSSTIILKQDIIEGIKREYEKEERVFI